jgi:hypothetical protein
MAKKILKNNRNVNMKGSAGHALLEMAGDVENELFHIETLRDYVGELCEKAGDERPYRAIEISYEQLFNMSGSLEHSLINIKRVMKEHVTNASVQEKQDVAGADK